MVWNVRNGREMVTVAVTACGQPTSRVTKHLPLITRGPPWRSTLAWTTRRAPRAGATALEETLRGSTARVNALLLATIAIFDVRGHRVSFRCVKEMCGSLR